MDIVDLQRVCKSQDKVEKVKRLLYSKEGFVRVLDNLHALELVERKNAYFVVTYNKQAFIEIVCIIPTVCIKTTKIKQVIEKEFKDSAIALTYEPNNNQLYKIMIASAENELDINYHVNKFNRVLDLLTGTDNTQTVIISTINNMIKNYSKRLETIGTINKNSTEYKTIQIKIQTLNEVLNNLKRALGGQR